LYNKYEPSKYENLNFNFIPMNRVEVQFIKSLYPYTAWDVGYLRVDQADRYEKAWTLKVLRNNKSMADRVVVETKIIGTKADIIAELEARGIEYKKTMNKNELTQLLW